MSSNFGKNGPSCTYCDSLRVVKIDGVLQPCPKCSAPVTVTFTVPYLTPPSVNHLYSTAFYTGKDGYGHRGRKISKEAKAFKEAVALFARGATVAPALDKDRKKARYVVDVEMTLGPRQRLDGDNGLKCAIDALVYAGVIHADHNVISRAIPIKDQRDNPHTTYTVTRLES